MESEPMFRVWLLTTVKLCLPLPFGVPRVCILRRMPGALSIGDRHHKSVTVKTGSPWATRRPSSHVPPPRIWMAPFPYSLQASQPAKVYPAVPKVFKCVSVFLRMPSWRVGCYGPVCEPLKPWLYVGKSQRLRFLGSSKRLINEMRPDRALKETPSENRLWTGTTHQPYPLPRLKGVMAAFRVHFSTFFSLCPGVTPMFQHFSHREETLTKAPSKENYFKSCILLRISHTEYCGVFMGYSTLSNTLSLCLSWLSQDHRWDRYKHVAVIDVDKAPAHGCLVL